MVCKSVYFDEVGDKNTEETLMLAKERADVLKINNIIVASTTGKTGIMASKIFKGYNLIVVSHVCGFKKPNLQQLSDKNLKEIENNGGKVLITTHAFGSLGRAVKNKFGTIQVDGIVSAVLRLFGQGTKVCCEISSMASDAGLVRVGEEVVAIGGTGVGLDTAIVLKPSNTHNFFDLLINEIVCKPRL
jgi:hypothetical protein